MAKTIGVLTFYYKNEYFMELQYHLFKKYMLNNFEFVACDDSPDNSVHVKNLETMCAAANL